MIVSLAALASCDGDDNSSAGGGDENDDNNPTEVALTLDKTALSLEIGKSYTLSVTGIPDEHAGKTLIWSSDDLSKVMVGSDGKVSAIDIETATVTVKVNGTQLSASCEVTVTLIMVSQITISKTELSLNVGQTDSLTVSVLPINASDKRIKWESSDATVVKVVNGNLAALKSGNAVITAMAMDGSGMQVSYNVTVRALTVASVTLNRTNLKLDKGENATLTANILPAGAVNK